MPVIFDKDGRGASPRTLVLRGLALLTVVVAVVGVLLMKSAGAFDSTVEVTAVLEQLGDGLPDRSDVKFRGVLVGTVSHVDPSTDGHPNQVVLHLDPQYAVHIPRTVTARVVPSNVFAVSSVQLVDNGPAPALVAHARIGQDHGLSTVQFQTALTRLRAIVAATARIGTGNTVGILAAVSQATDRRGNDLVQAGRQLDDITRQLNTVMAPDGGPSTLTALSDAVHGLDISAPDLLDTLHQAVEPMRTVAEQRDRITALIAGADGTFGTLGGGLDRHADRLVTTTNQFGPVLDVFADGGTSFTGIVEQLHLISGKFLTEFWDPRIQMGAGKFEFQLTPHNQYTRADCPRYGALVAPSCSTAPTTQPVPQLPPVLDPRGYPAPAGMTPQVQELMRRVLSGTADPVESMLAGLLTNGAPVAGGGR